MATQIGYPATEVAEMPMQVERALLIALFGEPKWDISWSRDTFEMIWEVPYGARYSPTILYGSGEWQTRRTNGSWFIHPNFADALECMKEIMRPVLPTITRPAHNRGHEPGPLDRRG